MKVLVPAVLTVVFLLVWQLASVSGWLSAIFFPAPTAIARALARLVANGELTEAVAATLGRVALGLVAGAVAGMVAGWLSGMSRWVRLVADPLVAALHPLPKLAVYPLFLVVLGIGEPSKIALVAVSVFFPVAINTQSGIQQIGRAYWEVATSYGASRWKLLRDVVLPGSLPMTLTGLKLGANTALLLTVAVEMIAAPTGLGALIWNSWNTLRTPDLYAALAVITVLGVATNSCFTVLVRFLTPWQHKEHP